MKTTKYKALNHLEIEQKNLRRKRIATVGYLLLLGGPCAIVGILTVLYLVGKNFSNKFSKEVEMEDIVLQNNKDNSQITRINSSNLTVPRADLILIKSKQAIDLNILKHFWRFAKRFAVEVVRNEFYPPTEQICLAQNSYVYIHNSLTQCGYDLKRKYRCFTALDYRCLSDEELKKLDKDLKLELEEYKNSEYYCVLKPSQGFLQFENSKQVDSSCCKDPYANSEYLTNICKTIH